MAEMTILHFASPFAFSAPVVESRGSESTGDDQGGMRQLANRTGAELPGAPATGARQNGIVDARDTRSAAMRAVDLAVAPEEASAPSGSLDAVLAAYQQDAPPMGGT